MTSKPDETGSERTALIAALAAQGVDLKGADWMSSEEIVVVVERWKNDLGAQKYGHLALLPPDSGSVRAEVCRGVTPSWVSNLSRPALVLFQEYAKTGILKCDWIFVLANIGQLAFVDGNGFVATTPNLDGVFMADVENGSEDPIVVIEAWGTLVSA